MGRLGIVATASLALGVLAGCGDEPPAPQVPSSAIGAERLQVSGRGVGSHAFGADADAVLAAVTERLGEPDSTDGPDRYTRIRGHDGWFEVADDPISPSWRYRLTSTTCWGVACLVFGGNDVDSLRLRGWVLTRHGATSRPDVRLAGSGIRLGDSWERLHAAYPDTEAHGAEGASLDVRRLPWRAPSDGVGAWRLSGTWDWTRPERVPPGARVTRLSAGEAPEPGCC